VAHFSVRVWGALGTPLCVLCYLFTFLLLCSPCLGATDAVSMSLATRFFCTFLLTLRVRPALPRGEGGVLVRSSELSMLFSFAINFNASTATRPLCPDCTSDWKALLMRVPLVLACVGGMGRTATGGWPCLCRALPEILVLCGPPLWPLLPALPPCTPCMWVLLLIVLVSRRAIFLFCRRGRFP
jgi:hypothetical protein